MGNWWSNEEVEFLEESWGNKSIPAIARKLDRSTNAVIKKAWKLGLGEQIASSNYVTFNQLIKELGYKGSYTWFFNKFKAHGCPIKSKKKLNRSYKVVNVDEFWKWAKNNKQILNFENFEEYALGKEPEWVKEKRFLDKKNKLNNKKLWTKEEDNLLIAKVKSNKYTSADLAQEFGRSEQAINKRLIRLNCPYRPVKPIKKTGWGIEENNELRKLFLEGYSTASIAKILNKSEYTTLNKIKLLKSNKDIELKNSRWTIQEELYLFKNKDKSNKELAIEMNRSEIAILNKRKRLDVNLLLTIIENQTFYSEG